MYRTPDKLAQLRAEFDDFAATFAVESGSEVMLRAEQVSAAIQRLEWALARQPQYQGRAAASGT